MPKLKYEQMLRQIAKARWLALKLGYRCAAGYLRNRGWSLEAAIWILFRKESRDRSVA
jgi:hypothetical protein